MPLGTTSTGVIRNSDSACTFTAESDIFTRSPSMICVRSECSVILGDGDTDSTTKPSVDMLPLLPP